MIGPWLSDAVATRLGVFAEIVSEGWTSSSPEPRARTLGYHTEGGEYVDKVEWERMRSVQRDLYSITTAP